MIRHRHVDIRPALQDEAWPAPAKKKPRRIGVLRG